jgi:ribosomal protein S18 acetylase RimI-like enzyme
MGINYNKHIVFVPKIEKRKKEHYNFIKKQFDKAYLSCEQFLKRDDLFVVVIRNGNNQIVGLCLVKDSLVEDKTRIMYPCSYLKPFLIFKEKPKRIINYNWLKPEYKINKCHVYRVIFTLVDRYFRGKGYNQMLLDFVYNKAIQHENVKKILASIRESNKPSLKSFLKNGYQISKLKTNPYKNGEKKIRVYKFVFRKMNIKIPQQLENQYQGVPYS